MHEFSICRAIVDAVLDELSKLGPGRGRLARVRIVAGASRQIAPENIVMAYEAMIKNTPADGSILEIESRPITARCGRCGWTGEIKGFAYMCGSCGAGDIELTGGKELFLDALEIEQDENS